MSYERTKRQLVGWAALIAALPLPFNGVLSWPLLAAYLIAVALFLYRVRREPERWLPMWAMNLLGFGYLPLFYVDLTLLSPGKLVEPVVHLLLFTVVVKLFALTRERDKWQTLMAVFFLFLTAMATSVHPTILIYLVVFLGLLLLLLTRFAFLHVLSGFGHRDASPALLPLGPFLTFALPAILLLAVPLFALLPRIRAPYIIGRGTGTGTIIQTTGFTEQVTLDSIGLARDNPEVVMRLRYEAPPPRSHDMRFKTGAHDRFRNGVWLRPGGVVEPLYRAPGERGFVLGEERPVAWLSVWLRPLLGDHLPLPVEAVRLDATTGMLLLSQQGTLSLMGPPEQPVTYRVGLAARPVSTAALPTEGQQESTLDLTGVNPAIAGLAARVAGDGTPREQADALQRHFNEEYEYSLDFLGRASDQPLEDFLFKYRSGHCEYFASAMVLMLRSVGIPARLITGYLGAEYNPLEGYFIVRQLNAHAWVEAYLPGEGWQVFEPTPAGGLPTGRQSWLPGLLGQAWDYVMFRWDRYVVTYGFYDQVRLAFRLWSGWRDFWERLSVPQPSTPEAGLEQETTPAMPEEPAAVAAPSSWPITLTLVLLAAGVAGWLLWRYHRGRPDATRAYRRLRRRLARSGLPLAEAVAPLAVRRATRRRFPAAEPAAGRIVELYLAESFGDRRLGEDERRELHLALAEADQALRRAS